MHPAPRLRMFFLALTMAAVAQASQAAGEAPALGGLDPVELCAGAEQHGVTQWSARHGRYLYHFASPENLERFQQDPERWAIQWDGGCGRMGPLSGAGDPDRWAVHDARIYIFASDGCREGFRSQPERFATSPAREPAPAPSSDMESAVARRWIDRAVAAHGGAEAIDALRSLTLREHSEVQGWHHEEELVVTADGRLSRRSDGFAPGTEGDSSSRWVLSAACSVEEDGHRRSITSPDAIRDLRRFAHREPIALLWARRSPDFEAIALGSENHNGVETARVLVRHQGLETTLHVSPVTGRILGLGWRGRPSDGITRDVVEEFTGWRKTQGILVPTSRRVSADGKPVDSLASTWSEVELATDVDEELFRQP